MPHEGDKIHIPLKTKDAIADLLKVKPTKDMPKPGANPTGPRMKDKTRCEKCGGSAIADHRIAEWRKMIEAGEAMPYYFVSCDHTTDITPSEEGKARLRVAILNR